MSDWLHSLPLAWMAVLVFGFVYLLTAAIHMGVNFLAIRGGARSFKAVSPGMLPPLGIIFGLFVAFTAAQVWNDNQSANAIVDREASALKSVVIFAASLPADAEARLRALIRTYAEEAATREWPVMAKREATLGVTPQPLAEALKLTLALAPANQGQETAQRKIVDALETAFDARRQRIILSRSQVNLVKWACLLLQAACALLAIALVHCDDRCASAITMGLFATGVAASVLLIAAHDRPFIGELAVGPEALLQALPTAQ